MKRWSLTALLFISMVGFAQADYIILIANLGSRTKGPAAATPGAMPGGYVPMPVTDDIPMPTIGGVGGGGGPPVPPPSLVTPNLGFDSDTLVMAVIEVAQAPRYVQPNVPLQLQHNLVPLGKSSILPTDNIKILPWTTLNGPMPSRNKQFEQKKTEVYRESKPSAESLVGLAEFALGRGMLKECEETMKKAADADKKHPAVVAFKKIEEDLARPAKPGDAAKEWQKKILETYHITLSPHYALLHTADDVKTRQARLEDTLKAFYYWFALHGKTLPVPEQRLVAVLVNKEDDFRHQHRVFGNPVRIGDGFYAARDNVAVFSMISLDQEYGNLRRHTQSLWNQYNETKLLMGQQGPVGVARTQEENMRNILTFFDASTKALFLKAMEVDSERSTISHDATRQLVAAAGLLPRNVAAPEWIQFGMGSFFESAKGSPMPSIGRPSPTFNDEYNYLYQFRKIASQDKKQEAKLALLVGTITDQFFRQASAKVDGRPPLRARTTAWALTFFLAHNKLDDLLTYFKELSQLPRDLEFDEEVLQTTFARAFKLTDANGKPDRGKMQTLANQWHDFINNQHLAVAETEEVLKQVQKAQNELKGIAPAATPGATPGAPIR